MNRMPCGTLLTLFGVAMLQFLPSCATKHQGVTSPVAENKQPTVTSTVTEQKSPFRFALATEGLPRDGLWKSTPVFADVNKDGFLDLAATIRKGDGARVWLGNGKGAWAESSNGLKFQISCGGGLAFGDINKDGHLDLAVADHCEGLFVYLGDGKGHWTVVTEAFNPPVPSHLKDDPREYYMGAEDLALGDVNEDGFLDIVVTASDFGGFTVLFGDGSGRSWTLATSDGLPSAEDPEPEDEEKGGWANQVLLQDMNGDGHLDVVASYYKGPRVWRGDGKGRWQAYSEGLPSPLIGGVYRGIAVGDINRDGRPDLVAANNFNGPEAYLQQPDGSWQALPPVAPSMGSAMGIALGDLDRDGHLDLVVTGTGSNEKRHGDFFGIFAYRGDGKGGWLEMKIDGLPVTGLSVPWGVAVADVNGDGLPDLAVGTGGDDEMRAPQAYSKGKPPVARPKTKAEIDSVYPRMQVWLNRSAQ